MQHFHMWPQAEIWSKVITILSIKKQSKEKEKKNKKNKGLGGGGGGGGGGGEEWGSHYKCGANDITAYYINLFIWTKNYHFPFCATSSFWNSSFYWLFCIAPLIHHFREDIGMKIWLNNWLRKALIKALKFYKKESIKRWDDQLKLARFWNKLMLFQRY